MNRGLTLPRLLGTLALGLVVLAFAAAIGIGLGSSWIPPGQVLRALFGGGEPTTAAIVYQARLPTVALGVMVGAFLGAGGAAMQGLLRNPLADPYILGISGGAAVGAALVIAGGLTSFAGVSTLPLAAFVGSLGAVGLITAIAAAMPGGLRGPGATMSLLLTGVVFNALASAVILVIYAVIAPMHAQELLFWLMGDLEPGRVQGANGWIAAGLGTVGVIVLTSQGGRLNALAFGDLEASSVGVDPGRTRAIVFAATALVVACGVAYAGLIGFVGLLVPHAVRLAFGVDHRMLIPVSALFGAAFLTLADAAGRASFGIAETSIPVGAVTALLGAPMFFVLLVRHLRMGRGDVA